MAKNKEGKYFHIHLNFSYVFISVHFNKLYLLPVK